jgi:PAS domain S-box-containing protein
VKRNTVHFFENSLDGIILTTPDGEILAANPAACNSFRMTEEEICQVGRTGIVDVEDPAVISFLEERKRTGKVKGELSFKRKDGTTFPGEVSSAIFTDGSASERTSMIIRI